MLAEQQIRIRNAYLTHRYQVVRRSVQTEHIHEHSCSHTASTHAQLVRRVDAPLGMASVKTKSLLVSRKGWQHWQPDAFCGKNVFRIAVRVLSGYVRIETKIVLINHFRNVKIQIINLIFLLIIVQAV